MFDLLKNLNDKEKFKWKLIDSTMKNFERNISCKENKDISS